jgi:hypothetical protein
MVGSFDEDEICSDFVGVLWDGFPDSDCAEDEPGDLGTVDHFTSQKMSPNVRIRRRG